MYMYTHMFSSTKQVQYQGPTNPEWSKTEGFLEEEGHIGI